MLPYNRHTAVVTIETGGRLDNGEWIEGNPREIIIRGRYVPGNNGGQVVKNRDGKEVIYRGRFITSGPCNDDATRISIKSKGIEAPIVNWYQYDTHTVIYI